MKIRTALGNIFLMLMMATLLARGDDRLRNKAVNSDMVGADVRCIDWELFLISQSDLSGGREVSGFIVRDVRNDSLIIQRSKNTFAIPLAAIETIVFRELRAETLPVLLSLVGGVGLGFLVGDLDEPGTESTPLGNGLFLTTEGGSKKPLWVGAGAVVGAAVGAVIAKNSGRHRISMDDSATAVAVTELLQRHIQTDGKAPIPWPPNLAFGVRGGVSIPTGSYAQSTGENSGSALAGYSLGLDFNMQLGRYNSWYTSALYSRSRVDVASLSVLIPGANVQAGSWSQIWLLTGMRFHAYDSPADGLYGSAQVGAFFGSSPEARVSLGNVSASQSSSDAATFAGSLGAGWILSPLHVGLQYTFALPEYDVTLVRPDQIVVRETFKQPTTLLSIFAGVML